MAKSQPSDAPLDVDWKRLAKEDSHFRAVYKEASEDLNFKDPATLRQITISTLRVYFGLEVELPLDRLCPPVRHGRYEYIRWLADLLMTTSPDFDDTIPTDSVVRGLDIGTGASCIYPLLGCASHDNWQFTATEVDQQSFENALLNVKSNDLAERISVKKRESIQPLIDPDFIPTEGKMLDFTMCNPPFYSSKDEITISESAKDLASRGICTGAEVEMIAEGGELAFVSRIIEDSIKLKDKVRWFSTMLGFNHNGKDIAQLLSKHGIENFAVTFFQPGHFTRRAGIAWSFSDLRPKINNLDYKGQPLPFQKIMPLRTRVIIERKGLDRPAAWKQITQLLLSRKAEWRPDQTRLSGLCLSKTDIWSRSARKKAQQQATANSDNLQAERASSEGEYTFVARISLLAQIGRDQIEVRWLKGTERRYFESLQGSLRGIADACEQHSTRSS